MAKIEEADSFQLRKGLLEAIDEYNEDENDEDFGKRMITMTVIDVTGSLGVWGISQ